MKFHVIDSSGICRFENIFKFAKAMLSLPFSDACVERIFLQLHSIVKNKLRNRMQCKLLNAVLQVRYGSAWKISLA